MSSSGGTGFYIMKGQPQKFCLGPGWLPDGPGGGSLGWPREGTARDLFQYKDCLYRNADSNFKARIIVRLSYIYNGNSHKTASYWNVAYPNRKTTFQVWGTHYECKIIMKIIMRPGYLYKGNFYNCRASSRSYIPINSYILERFL